MLRRHEGKNRRGGGGGDNKLLEAKYITTGSASGFLVSNCGVGIVYTIHTILTLHHIMYNFMSQKGGLLQTYEQPC